MLAKFYRVFENSTGVFWNLYVKNYTDLFCFQTNYNKLPLAVVNNQHTVYERAALPPDQHYYPARNRKS